MKKKLWLAIIILALITAVIFVFCACSDDQETSSEELLPEDNLEDPNLEDIPELEESKCKITFIGLNDEIIAEIEVKEGEKIDPPEAKQYDGYVFKEWEMPSDTAATDMTVTAIYAKLYKITVKFSGINIQEQEYTIEEGLLISDKVNLQSVQALIPDGYYITGDYAEEYSYDRIADKDIILEIQCAKRVYTITLNDNVKDIPLQTKKIEHGEIYTPPNISTKGYIFKGWYTDTECTKPYEPQEIKADLTLYAKWEEVTKDTHIELATDEDIEILKANPYAQYTITGDIDLAKIAKANIPLFTGVLNGNNKTAILGNKPLFKENKGTIRNLNIQVQADNAEIYKQEDKSNFAYGAICAINTGTIENCSVSGNITAASDKTVYIGGVCGINNGEIKGVSVDIEILCEQLAAQSAIGGVAGSISAVNTTISDITCDVKILSNSTVIHYCGGIVGIISTSDITLSDMTVYAEITAMVAGGIIGNVSMKGTTLSGAINITTAFTDNRQSGDIAGFDESLVTISEGAIITINDEPYKGT